MKDAFQTRAAALDRARDVLRTRHIARHDFVPAFRRRRSRENHNAAYPMAGQPFHEVAADSSLAARDEIGGLRIETERLAGFRSWRFAKTRDISLPSAICDLLMRRREVRLELQRLIDFF